MKRSRQRGLTLVGLIGMLTGIEIAGAVRDSQAQMTKERSSYPVTVSGHCASFG